MAKDDKRLSVTGADDNLPPYTETPDQKASRDPIPDPDPEQHHQEQQEEESHTIWLTFTGASAPSVPTTILLTTNSTFLDFQRKIKHRYLETRRVTANRNRIAFIWSTFLTSSISSDPLDGICLDEHNWESIKSTLLNNDRPESFPGKLQKKRLQKPGGSSSDVVSPRLVVTFCDVNWAERRPARNPEMLERQQKAHERNERAFLVQGRHLPPPRMGGCVVM